MKCINLICLRFDFNPVSCGVMKCINLICFVCDLISSGCLVVWRSALTWIVLSAFDSFQLVSYGVMKIYYDYSTIVCRFHSDELHHVRFFPLISEIAYLSEMADSCDEILNNGLYVNLTYRLHNQTTDADSFQNCCKFSSASFVTFYGLYVRRIHT